MKSIKDILQTLRESNPALSHLSDFDMQELWEKTMDELIKDQAAVDRFEEGCLYLVVRDSVWLTELTLRKKDLMDNLNKALDKNVVMDIKFKAGPVKVKKIKRHKSLKIVPLPPDVENEIKLSLEKIDDPEVKRMLERIFKKSYSLSRHDNSGNF